MTDLPAFERID